MKRQVLIIVACVVMCATIQNSNAVIIEPPSGSEVFTVKKVVMSQDNCNSSFDNGNMGYWSTVNGGSASTNEIVAADGEYYAKLSAWYTDTRPESRIDTYRLRTGTGPEYGNIFRISGYLYFPEASGDEEPAGAIGFIYGLNNENDWKETLGNKYTYYNESPSNEWIYVEYYAQTTQEVFTGISPRISHYTSGIDTNKIYVGYVDGLKVEQGVYQKLGSVLIIQ